MIPAISQKCRDKIVEFEIGSRAYYDKIACHPVWPGGASGITIGIGYDLGQHTVQEFIDDWSGTTVNYSPALQAVCGHKGANAKWLLHTVEDMTIPYDAAVKVFDATVLPRYIAMTAKTFPNCSQLPADAFGALVDLVFNRGPDTSSLDDRRAEMRAIKMAMTAMHTVAIPSLLRGMKRLWPHSTQLQARRDWEAATFERAMAGATIPELPVPVVRTRPTVPELPVPVARPKPKPVPLHHDDEDVVDTGPRQPSDEVSDELNQQELERKRRRYP